MTDTIPPYAVSLSDWIRQVSNAFNPFISNVNGNNNDLTGGWTWNYSNPDGAGGRQLESSIPTTVNMNGGGGVQGCGIIISGSTSAATPNSGFAETDCIRLNYTVNSAAGVNVMPYLVNGVMTNKHNIGSGNTNECGAILVTNRAQGPTAGGSNWAIGIWGGDFHAEKSSGVAPGKMVGLEVGVHSDVTQTYGDATQRQNGIELWSGARGIAATGVQAHDALKIFGGGGWTKFFNFIHTDGTIPVCTLDNLGNLVLRSPTGSMANTFTVASANNSNTLTITGKDSGNAAVNLVLQSQSGGQINIGSTTNHPVVLTVNNAEVFRLLSGFLGKTPSGIESTGAGSAALGANCPASTVTAPYKWIKAQTSDGSTVYIPAWK